MYHLTTSGGLLSTPNPKWYILATIFSYPILETAEIEATFLELAEQWRRETGMMSLVTKMSMHPAYQRIIGMGQAVVPPILRELEQEPDRGFWALQAITGANPVKSEQRGRLKQMAEAWIQWGRENGYRWQARTV